MSNVPPALASQRQAFLAALRLRGVDITYSDGTNTVELKAVKTSPRAQQLDDTDGVIFESNHWHWLVDGPALGGIEPQLGHTITEKVGGAVFKLQPSNPNDLPYRWSDGLKTFMRIFTEQQ